MRFEHFRGSQDFGITQSFHGIYYQELGRTIQIRSIERVDGEISRNNWKSGNQKRCSQRDEKVAKHLETIFWRESVHISISQFHVNLIALYDCLAI